MKEIDFLPEWYKSGKRREISYRTQYIALGGVFVVMVVWNFIAAHSISTARAQFAQMETRQIQAKGLSIKLDELKSELRGLQEKAESIEEIDSKIDVAGVLAEMSFLIDEKIVLGKVEFIAEKFENKLQDELSPRGSNVVRAVRAAMSGKQELPLGDVRFRVVIGGVAADASDVAALICTLEESPYFCQVVPSFSRTTMITAAGNSSLHSKIKNEGAKGTVQKNERNTQVQVSEFEISTYLANYREQ
jgi:Tfp pilus assembly protein PilN